MGKNPQNACPRYGIKLHLIVRLQFWRSLVWSTPLSPLSFGLLCPEMVVPVGFLSLGQIDIFKITRIQ